MRVGTFNAGSLASVDDVVGWARAAAADGFDTVWLPQVMGLDALTTLEKSIAERERQGK